MDLFYSILFYFIMDYFFILHSPLSYFPVNTRYDFYTFLAVKQFFIEFYLFTLLNQLLCIFTEPLLLSTGCLSLLYHNLCFLYVIEPGT